MDIVGASMAMRQQETMTSVNIAVLSKNLDTMETIGAGMIEMMEQSVQPNLGQNIDIRL